MMFRHRLLAITRAIAVQNQKLMRSVNSTYLPVEWLGYGKKQMKSVNSFRILHIDSSPCNMGRAQVFVRTDVAHRVVVEIE
jgi:hypothetical protein